MKAVYHLIQVVVRVNADHVIEAPEVVGVERTEAEPSGVQERVVEVVGRLVERRRDRDVLKIDREVLHSVHLARDAHPVGLLEHKTVLAAQHVVSQLALLQRDLLRGAAVHVHLHAHDRPLKLVNLVELGLAVVRERGVLDLALDRLRLEALLEHVLDHRADQIDAHAHELERGVHRVLHAAEVVPEDDVLCAVEQRRRVAHAVDRQDEAFERGGELGGDERLLAALRGDVLEDRIPRRLLAERKRLE